MTITIRPLGHPRPRLLFIHGHRMILVPGRPERWMPVLLVQTGCSAVVFSLN